MWERGLNSYCDTLLDVLQGVGGGVAQIKVVTLSEFYV